MRLALTASPSREGSEAQLWGTLGTSHAYTKFTNSELQVTSVGASWCCLQSHQGLLAPSHKPEPSVTAGREAGWWGVMRYILFCLQIAFSPVERGTSKCEMLSVPKEGCVWLRALPETYQGSRAKPLPLPQSLVPYAETGMPATQSVSSSGKCIIPSEPRDLSSKLLQPSVSAHLWGLGHHRQLHYLFLGMPFI